MRRRAVLAAGLALLATGPAGPAGATHLPDHRFIVLGYVTNGEGRGLADVRVTIRRGKTGLAYQARTERDGFYLVVLHMHDADEGDRLTLGANGVTGQIVARYDIGDKKVERGTRVDFRPDGIVEDRHAFAETLRAFIAR
jgi:hypothetical protein